MKRIALILLLLAPLCVVAQESADDVVYNIMGVRFGSMRNVVSNTLEQSYGSLDFNDASETYVAYLDKYYDGTTWDFIAFYFSKKNKFYKCVMSILCTTLDEARDERDRLGRRLRQQGNALVTKYKSDDGEAYYLGGTSPTDENQYGYTIEVSTSSVTGKPYSAMISYGAYDY